jgi:catechol 2,3-dioxygenase-like lactoylglutathione lyase family enzyme
MHTTHRTKGKQNMRIRHIAFVVSDLEASAGLLEEALGLDRVGARTPGNFPGKALDMTDGEVNLSLLQLASGVPDEWRPTALGPLHVGVVVSDIAAAQRALERRGIRVYATKGEPPTFFKFTDPDGIEFDVASSNDPFPTAAQDKVEGVRA